MTTIFFTGLTRTFLSARGLIFAFICSSTASHALADPSDALTIDQERDLLLGKWVGVTYDMNGKVNQKLGKREAIEMEFSLQKGLPENGVIVSYKQMGIRGLPFSHHVGVGLSRGGIGSIEKQKELSIAILEGSQYTPPNYLAYKVTPDSLTLMPHLNPEDSLAPSLKTAEGDDRIIIHFQRKNERKKSAAKIAPRSDKNQ